MTRVDVAPKPRMQPRTPQSQFTSVRIAVALCASLVAIFICLHRRHVHIVPSAPSTYTSPLHHRCGLLMIVCVGWATVELISSVRRLQVSARLRVSHSATHPGAS
jgi:hypothetical protein